MAQAQTERVGEGSGFDGQGTAAPAAQVRQIAPGAVEVRINLDANASAAPTPAVISAVLASLRSSANPSSAHGAGQEARASLEVARDAVASLCEGLYPENVVFTSGCTEANNLVVASARALGATLITTTVEHPSILRPAQALQAKGKDVRFLTVDAQGLVDVQQLSDWLDEIVGSVVVSVQTANSETGVVQPIAVIARRLAARGDCLFHSDAAQSFGKSITPIGGESGPDVVSISGHKLHAPMGVGAILMRDGEARLTPSQRGGDQEQGLRAGTQALPMIAGLGAACGERAGKLASDVAHMAALRDRLERGVTEGVRGVTVNGAGAPRLPNVTNLLFPGVDAMALVAHLDAEGVLVSQGSACSSRRPEPSHVLTAMGLDETRAFSCVRFSVSPLNTLQEIDATISIVADICRRLEISA